MRSIFIINWLEKELSRSTSGFLFGCTGRQRCHFLGWVKGGKTRIGGGGGDHVEGKGKDKIKSSVMQYSVGTAGEIQSGDIRWARGYE